MATMHVDKGDLPPLSAAALEGAAQMWVGLLLNVLVYHALQHRAEQRLSAIDAAAAILHGSIEHIQVINTTTDQLNEAATFMRATIDMAAANARNEINSRGDEGKTTH